MHDRTRRHAGMTLIEAVIAAGLLVFALFGLASVIVSARGASRTIDERALATAAAEARVAALRAELHRVAWTDAATKDAQLAALIARHGTSEAIDLLEGFDAAAGGKIPATRTVFVYHQSEVDAAQPDDPWAPPPHGGLGRTNLDFDADGGFAGAAGTDYASPGDLHVVGVKVVVTWRQATWSPGDPVSRAVVSALLY